MDLKPPKSQYIIRFSNDLFSNCCRKKDVGICKIWYTPIPAQTLLSQKKDLSRQSGAGSMMMMMMRERGCSPDAYVVTVQYGSRNRIEGTHERFHCSTNSPFNKALEYYLHPSHNNLRKLSGRWHSRLADPEPTRLTAQNLTHSVTRIQVFCIGCHVEHLISRFRFNQFFPLIFIRIRFFHNLFHINLII